MCADADLGKSASAHISLSSRHHGLRRRCLFSVRERLETRHAVECWYPAAAQSNSISLVLHLDPAARHLATHLRLARFVDHAVRLLFILGRTPLRAAMACRAVVAGADHRSGPCRSDYAGGAEADGSGRVLAAL